MRPHMSRKSSVVFVERQGRSSIQSLHNSRPCCSAFFTLQNPPPILLTSTIDPSWVGLQTIPRTRCSPVFRPCPCADVKPSGLFCSYHQTSTAIIDSGSSPDSHFALASILNR